MAATEVHRTRVLLVEDEFLISAMLADELSQQGFEVQTFAKAADALRHLADGVACDVLFTDINLCGGLDGVELAARARDLRPHLPVVYSSGSIRGLDEIRAVSGARFVPKPINLNVIGAIVRQAALTSA